MKKLKSKHTRVIGELVITDKHYAVNYEDDASHTATAIYTSLDNLNKDWEDYDETETYFINAVGGISINALADKKTRENFYKQLKAIGNYFETKEEAEQAVEKLRAWKVLKDMGFKIAGIRYRNNKNYVEWYIPQKVRDDYYAVSAFNEALHLLFGGEE